MLELICPGRLSSRILKVEMPCSNKCKQPIVQSASTHTDYSKSSCLALYDVTVYNKKKRAHHLAKRRFHFGTKVLL